MLSLAMSRDERTENLIEIHVKPKTISTGNESQISVIFMGFCDENFISFFVRFDKLVTLVRRNITSPASNQRQQFRRFAGNDNITI